MPPYNPRAQRRAIAAAKRKKPKPVAVVPPRPSADAAQPTTKRERKEIAREQRRNEHRRKQREKRKEKLLTSRATIGVPITDKDLDEVKSAVLGIPGGLFKIAKDVGQDVSDIGHGRVGRRKKRIPFSRTARNAEEIGKATYRDLRHPTRNPLMTALTAYGVASGTGGAAARGSAAAKAAKAGEGARGVAKAIASKPVPEVRTHTHRGQPVRGRYSTNPVARAVQKRTDKGSSEISAAKSERLLSEERRVTDAAAKAPALRALAAAPGRRASSKILRRFGLHPSGTVEDAAIRVVAEGVPLDDVIAAHKARAAEIEVRIKNRRRGGVPGGGHTRQQAFRLDGARRELLRRAALYEEARKYLDVDENGEPVISGKHPELAEKYGKTQTAALTRESRAKGMGLLTREAAERRKNAPGAMNVRTVSGGRAIKVERPRTISEAQARLEKLEAKVETVVSKLASEEAKHNLDLQLAADLSRRSPNATGWVADEVVRRKHGGGIDIQRTGEASGRYVEAEQRGQGAGYTRMELARKAMLNELIERGKNPKAHPSIRRFNEALDEIQELRAALAVEAEKGTFAEGLTEGGSLGNVTEFKGFDEVEPFNAGKFRVPDVLRSQRVPHGPLAYRGGVPRQPGTLTHEYTGALRRSGKYTPHTVRAVAEDALEFERYASADRFRQRLLPMGVKQRPLDTRRVKYAPLRTRQLTKKESTELRKLLDEVDPETLTPDEAVRIEERLKAYEREIFPEPAEYAHVRAGESVPGVVWVDRRLLGSQRKLIGRLPVIDAASDVIKGLILYLKPGYVAPNVLGNVGYNLFQQGLLAPANWSRAVRLPRDLDFMLKEVMGSGYSRALAEGTMSPASYAVRKAGDFWSHFVDDPFRKAAFLHEARRYGFKSDEQLRSLIMDGQHRSTLGEVAQRARDAIVDYERLGPIERDLVRRVLFVYPWIKGSTYYAGQFLRDHPVQAMVFEKIGEQGASEALRELGPMPAWAQGSFKVGGSEDQPYIVNPQSVSPFSTPAQVVGMAQGAFGDVERSEQIGEATNPLLQSGFEALFGRDLFTGRELHGSIPERFVEQTTKGLPQYLLYKRGGLNFLPGVDEHVSPDATYPYSPADARAQFVLGSAFPRPANRAKLNEQAAGPPAPGEAAKRTVARERDELVDLLKKISPESLGPNGEAPKPLEKALQRKTTVYALRDKIEHDIPAGVERERAKYAAEVELLAKWGAMTEKEARSTTRWSKGASEDAVRDARRWLVDNKFDDAYQGLIRDYRHYLEERE